MKRPAYSKVAFVVMGIFLAEIIGLVQAVFSAQMLVHELENRSAYVSEMLLSQFIGSYTASSAIQSDVDALGYKSLDRSLTALYHSLREIQKLGPDPKPIKYLCAEGRYEVEILSNVPENRKAFEDQLGIDIATVSDFKILSYDLKQGDRLLMGRRILVGLSEDKRWLISIQINQKALREQLNTAKRTLAGLLNSAYYFNDKTGNFYVFSSNGKLLYQGGLEKNTEAFDSRDLNSGKTIKTLVLQGRDSYQEVIFKKGDEAHRSQLRTRYDADKGLYFVYEIDHDKMFKGVDDRLRMTWMLGVAILISTVLLLWAYWRFYQKSGRNAL